MQANIVTIRVLPVPWIFKSQPLFIYSSRTSNGMLLQDTSVKFYFSASLRIFSVVNAFLPQITMNIYPHYEAMANRKIYVH